MDQDYFIFHKYIRQLDYDAPTPEELFLEEGAEDSNLSNEIKLSVELQKESGLFHVDLQIILNATMPSGASVFSLNLVYRGIAAVNFSMTDDKIRECLNIRIPQELYSAARKVVENVTMVSGFSTVKMEMISFAKGTNPTNN